MKPKAKSRAAASLPKRPPRRSGRRGIGPAPEPNEQPESAAPSDEKKRPRQARLPQMEDPEIEELEAKAEEYADIRDQRMELTPVEAKLKEELLGLMEKHGKTSYVHDGYDIKVIVESKKVKVRVHKDKGD